MAIKLNLSNSFPTGTPGKTIGLTKMPLSSSFLEKACLQDPVQELFHPGFTLSSAKDYYGVLLGAF